MCSYGVRGHASKRNRERESAQELSTGSNIRIAYEKIVCLGVDAFGVVCATPIQLMSFNAMAKEKS